MCTFNRIRNQISIVGNINAIQNKSALISKIHAKLKKKTDLNCTSEEMMLNTVYSICKTKRLLLSKLKGLIFKEINALVVCNSVQNYSSLAICHENSFFDGISIIAPNLVKAILETQTKSLFLNIKIIVIDNITVDATDIVLLEEIISTDTQLSLSN